MALRLYRAGVLLGLVLLVHVQARWNEAKRSVPISIRQAQKFFPHADRVQLRDPDRGWYVVVNARGEVLGGLLRTSPFTDQIMGYSGPSDVLIALDNRGVVAGLELLRSGDTPEHVSKVRSTPGFLRAFIGWNPSEAPPPKVDAVSGATLTSLAIAESVEQRLAGAAPSLRFPEPVTLAEIQTVFTNATRMVAEKSRWRVFDRSNHLLGFALRTSPQADNIPGYRGPTDCLVGVDPSGQKVLGVSIRQSFDTASYVEQVRRSQPFLGLFVGQPIGALAQFQFPARPIEGVSGATQTARAAAEGMRRRLAGELKGRSSSKSWRPQARDWALAGVVGGALALSLTPLRGQRWARLAWQLVLVGYVGLVNHDLLSLALLGGWAVHGWTVRTAPGLALLAAASFLVPWSTRRQLYCHQICPHGAAQQLLGHLGQRWRGWYTSLSAGRSPHRLAWMLSIVGWVPSGLLALTLCSLLLDWNLSLASLEPFDAWVWSTASVATLLIAGIGLLASLFMHQPYCRYGCPTGALLGFIRSAGSADRWGRRDTVALGLVVLSGGLVLATRTWPSRPPEVPPMEWHGLTMGTTWSVKIRDEVADPAAIEKAIAREFEWAESMTSHWRTNTDLSVFNRTATTNAFPVPWPVVTLTRWAAEISRATGGAYDVTVGPLVRLWGFGYNARPQQPPSRTELEAARARVDWQKLEIADGLLRKLDPNLEVDLSSIAKGWAVDQVLLALERRGYTNVLVEAGGELRVRGRWKVAIEEPLRRTELQDEALASSGVYRQNYKSGGQRLSHLIDPATGRPVAHNTVSVSVRHPDCAHADAWATAFNVLGLERGLPLAEQLHLAVQFAVEQPGGRLQVHESTAWKERSGPQNSGVANDRRNG